MLIMFGTGLALDALKSQAASFAPIVFGKEMIIAGSALANYWRERPEEKQEHKKETKW